MPYADRQQQLEYMRAFTRRKRALSRIERLKQHKANLLKRYEEEPMMKYFVTKEELGSAIPRQIEECLKVVRECDGLLKIGPNSHKSRGGS